MSVFQETIWALWISHGRHLQTSIKHVDTLSGVLLTWLKNWSKLIELQGPESLYNLLLCCLALAEAEAKPGFCEHSLHFAGCLCFVPSYLLSGKAARCQLPGHPHVPVLPEHHLLLFAAYNLIFAASPSEGWTAIPQTKCQVRWETLR